MAPKRYVWETNYKLTIVALKFPKLTIKCECWTIKDIYANHFFKTKSCWCIHKWPKIKHWLAKTRWYNIYQWIKQRCYNKNHESYYRYWWRWITMCDEWLKWVQYFHKDMKEWYSDNLTLDRIDNDWSYCKDNCRWATAKQQASNTRYSIPDYIIENSL